MGWSSVHALLIALFAGLIFVLPPTIAQDKKKDADKKKVVTELKQALKGADELILATDEDREGEAIGWHVREVLQPKVPVRRMVFHEITADAIRAAAESSS